MSRSVSIIILSLDQFAFTSRLLLTLASTRGRFETVLVDNGSRSKTVERLRALEASPLAARLGLRCAFNDKNLGIANGRNQGAALARGEVLLFLDNDVEVIEPGWLERLLAVYGRSPKEGVVGGTLLNPDRSIQFAGGTVDVRGRVTFDTDSGEDETIRSTMFCLGACFSTPRDCWESVGGFDSGYSPLDYEDIDYCLRAHELGRESLVAAGCRLVHHGHVTTGTGAAGFSRIKHYLASGRRFRKRWENPLADRNP